MRGAGEQLKHHSDGYIDISRMAGLNVIQYHPVNNLSFNPHFLLLIVKIRPGTPMLKLAREPKG